MLLVKANRASGVRERDDVLLFELETDDGQTINLSMTIDCLLQLFGGGWQLLGKKPTPSEGASIRLQGRIGLGTFDMEPCLLLTSGPGVLSLLTGAEGLASLRDDIDQHLQESRSKLK